VLTEMADRRSSLVSQVQLKQTSISVTVFCTHCRQEQRVHTRILTGNWSGALQWVKCLKCREYFDVVIPNAIIGSPSLP
jgi:transcription elongation factor Elf1